MGCKILVSNKSAVTKAEIVMVLPYNHEFGYGESMQEWIKSGRLKEDWPRTFSIVIIGDANVEYINKLNDVLPTEVNKYHFKDPDITDPIFIELYNNGEVHTTMSEADKYLIERV